MPAEDEVKARNPADGPEPSCPQGRLLSAYHDGELAPEQARSVEQHLAACADCASQLEQLRRLSALMAHQPLGQPLPGFRDRLHASVNLVQEAAVVRLAERVAALAAAVLVAFGLWLWHQEQGPSQSSVLPQSWEIAMVTSRPDSPASSAEEALGLWVVWDLQQEKSHD